MALGEGQELPEKEGPGLGYILVYLALAPHPLHLPGLGRCKGREGPGQLCFGGP